jgi:hypothetical protein
MLCMTSLRSGFQIGRRPACCKDRFHSFQLCGHIAVRTVTRAGCTCSPSAFANGCCTALDEALLSACLGYGRKHANLSICSEVGSVVCPQPRPLPAHTYTNTHTTNSPTPTHAHVQAMISTAEPQSALIRPERASCHAGCQDTAVAAR